MLDSIKNVTSVMMLLQLQMATYRKDQLPPFFFCVHNLLLKTCILAIRNTHKNLYNIFCIKKTPYDFST